MSHSIHEGHAHVHGENCGHTRISHEGHVDYLHDGHLHAAHDEHFDECVLPVSAANPADCNEAACLCGHDGCGHEQVPHGDHMDYLIGGRLHHRHGNHCDDHGAVSVM